MSYSTRWIALVLSSGTLTHCALDTGSDIELEEFSAGEVDLALTPDQICSTVNSIGTISLGTNSGSGGSNSDSGFVTITPKCENDSGSELSYLGSTAPASFSGSVSRVLAQTLYCSLTGSDNATALGTIDTAVGKFGIESKMNVYKRDSKALTLSAQRVGKLYAFGVGLDLENQDFQWNFASEGQPQQSVKKTNGQSVTIPAHTGQYAKMATQGHPWRIDASATFPIGPVGMSIGLAFGSPRVNASNLQFPFDAADTRAYTMVATGSSAAVRRASWDTFIAACNDCKSKPPTGVPCDCPTAAEQAQHDRVCSSSGCTDSFYNNLADGRLPHEGRRGASGPFWDAGKATDSDWWHFGKPGAGAAISYRAAGEPVFSVKTDASGATTGLDLSVGAKFDVGVADIGLTVHMANDYQNGIAVRQYRVPFGDVNPLVQQTEVGIDASSATGVDARVVLNVDIPFVGTTTMLDETFDIVTRSSTFKASKPNIASKVVWDYTGETPTIYKYYKNGVDSSWSSCLSAPTVSEPPIEVRDPKEFVAAIKAAIPTKLYLCNVKMCVKDTVAGAPHVKTCTWNKTTKKLVCTNSTASCSCADNAADLCDASGKVYKPKSVKRPSGCEPW